MRGRGVGGRGCTPKCVPSGRESSGRKEGPAAPGKLAPDVRNHGKDRHAFDPALLDRTMLPIRRAEGATAKLDHRWWKSFLRADCRLLPCELNDATTKLDHRWWKNFLHAARRTAS